MNIQIFGKSKCFDTKAAQRFFKERKISFQYIDILEKGLSKRELDGAAQFLRGIGLLIDCKSPLYESLNIGYIKRSDEDLKELLLANPQLYCTPIVRECGSKKYTVGNAQKTWELWLK